MRRVAVLADGGRRGPEGDGFRVEAAPVRGDGFGVVASARHPRLVVMTIYAGGHARGGGEPLHGGDGVRVAVAMTGEARAGEGGALVGCGMHAAGNIARDGGVGVGPAVRAGGVTVLVAGDRLPGLVEAVRVAAGVLVALLAFQRGMDGAAEAVERDGIRPDRALQCVAHCQVLHAVAGVTTIRRLASGTGVLRAGRRRRQQTDHECQDGPFHDERSGPVMQHAAGW